MNTKQAVQTPPPTQERVGEWWRGTGRGYVRDFIEREGERWCEACQAEHPVTSFPTLEVPRVDGTTRGRICRAALAEQRRRASQRRARQAAAKKAAATRAAKKGSKAATSGKA